MDDDYDFSWSIKGANVGTVYCCMRPGPIHPTYHGLLLLTEDAGLHVGMRKLPLLLLPPPTSRPAGDDDYAV